MRYTPGMMDEWDRQEARRLRPHQETPGETQMQVLFIGSFLALAGLYGITEGYLLFSLVFLILGCYMVFIYPTKGKAQNEGFKQWLEYIDNRHLEYYGFNPNLEWYIFDKVAFGSVLNNVPNRDYDAWTEKFLLFDHMKPEDYIEQMPDGSYDYTRYFVELAYRYMVTCKRIGSVAHITNMAEAMSYKFFGIGQVRGDSLKLSEYSSQYITHHEPPFRAYQMSRQQYHDLVDFDYTITHTNLTNWVYTVWNAAKSRVDAEAESHKPFIPFDERCLNEVERLKNMAWYVATHKRERNDVDLQLLQNKFLNA